MTGFMQSTLRQRHRRCLKPPEPARPVGMCCSGGAGPTAEPACPQRLGEGRPRSPLACLGELPWLSRVSGGVWPCSVAGGGAGWIDGVSPAPAAASTQGDGQFVPLLCVSGASAGGSFG